LLKVIATIVALLTVATISISLAEAQTLIVTEVPAADYSFGQHITFHLRATAPTDITQVNLFLRIEGQSDTMAVPVVFEPSPQVQVDYPFSLVEHSVPPFANISYWWEIRDANGAQQRTEEKQLFYADNRYEWQPLVERRGGVSWEVYWVQGDVVFGQTAVNVAAKALDEIYRELRVPVPGAIRIFIYPSEQDLRSALSLGGYAWAGGQARPELGAILIGVPEGPAALSEMERLLPHELTHLMVYEATGRRLGLVPPWLNEGLASLNELRPDPNRQALVEEALAQNRLFSLETLCAPFPADQGAARLAYAQSASVVGFLREQHGGQVIRDLLATYAENASCEGGVNRVLGQSLGELESAWRAQLTGQGPTGQRSSSSAVWVALWLLTALLALPLVGVLRGAGASQSRQEL
jgi:hypothetical protein